ESARKNAVKSDAGQMLGGVCAYLSNLTREVHRGAVVPPIIGHAVEQPQNGEFLRLGAEPARQRERAPQPGYDVARRSKLDEIGMRDSDFERKFVSHAPRPEFQDVPEGGLEILL